MINKQSLFYTFSFIIGFWIIISLSRSILHTYKNRTRLINLRQQVSESEQMISELHQKLSYQQTDAFVEKQARNKLNLIKPGEKAFIFTYTPDILGEQDSEINITEEIPNWQKWRQLFFHF